MASDLSPEPRTVVVLALLLAVLVALSGCGTRSTTDENVQRTSKGTQQTVTKEVTVRVPLENGGERIERTLTTNVVSSEAARTTTSEVTQTGLDAPTASMVDGFGQLAGYAISTATANPSGTLIGTGIAGLLTAGLTAWGASKNAQAKQLREERDFHRDDADQAYKKLDARQAASSA